MPISLLNVPFLSGTDKFQEGMLEPGKFLQQQLANQLLGTQAKYAEPLTKNDLLAKELQNRINQVKANYAEPTAQEELKKAQLYNQWYTPDIRSLIASRGASTNLANLQAQEAAYKLAHPGYLAGGNAANLQYLQDLLRQGQAGMPTAGGQAEMPTVGGQPTTAGIPNQPMMPGQQGEQPIQAQMTTPAPQQTNQIPFNDFVRSEFNRIVYGSPLSPQQQMENKQAEKNLADYDKELAATNVQAKQAQNLNNTLDEFKYYYDRSGYRGTGIGGAGSFFEKHPLPGKDLSNEQNTDVAGNNIQALVAKSLFPNRVTDTDLAFAKTLKPHRGMDPKAIEEQYHQLKAIISRNNEYDRFIYAAYNQGVKLKDAQRLYDLYAKDRPVIDPKTHKINIHNLDSSLDYLNPEAIQAIRQGKKWSPKRHPEAYSNLSDEMLRAKRGY